MRIHYSHEADALYIRLRETAIENTDEITEDIIMDYDKNGQVVGIEILSASERADVQEIIIQAFNNVKVEQSAHM
jgi:uncharacterized protein YuzE